VSIMIQTRTFAEVALLKRKSHVGGHFYRTSFRGRKFLLRTSVPKTSWMLSLSDMIALLAIGTECTSSLPA
jgi:hypothetical protein